MIERKAKAKTAGAVVAAVALATAIGVLGCAPEAPRADGEATDLAGTGAATYEEWIEQYPYVYESFAQSFLVHGDASKEFSHYAQYPKEVEYVAQYEDGPYSYISGTCIACKTSGFNAAYKQFGDAAFAMSEDDLGDLTYFDCTTCHTDSTSLTLEPSLVAFKLLSGTAMDGIDTEALICGQCHNAVGQYGYTLNESWGAADAQPYRYGYDADSLYRAYIEDGQGALDEETGAVLAAPSYSDLELVVQGNHYALGLTCVDCHVTPTTSSDGTTFASHNHSSSPLENEAALEKCLACHQSQGIEDAEAMVAFYREKESDFAALKEAADVAIANLQEALKDATAANRADDAVDKARENYAQAKFFVAYSLSYNHDDGYRVAHNDVDMTDLVQRAQSLAEEGVSLLA